MGKNLRKIDQIILYTSALCNLQCSYCYICKNPGLNIVDAEMDKSFADPNYYYELFAKYVDEENTKDLKGITFFGGESLLKFDRCIPTLQTFVEKCPGLDVFFIYTNFTTPDAVPMILKFTDMLAKYSERYFKIDVQISLDGPAEITDQQRGPNVTSRIFANLQKLLDCGDQIAENVTLEVHPKATISHENVHKFLDIDYMINYYKFFEDNFVEPIMQKRCDRITLGAWCIPNIANPWDSTQEDGKMLKQLMDVFNELDKRDNEEHIFKYKTFTVNWFYKHSVYMRFNEDWIMPAPFCPFGISTIGLLPGNKYCTCTQVFPAYCETYVKDYNAGYVDSSHMIESGVDKDMITDDLEHLVTYNKRILQFNQMDPHKTALISYCTNLVQQLAKVGQVDAKYTDPVEAENAVQLVFTFYGICACQNIIDSGNEMLIPTAAFKRYLNGCVDELSKTFTIVDSEEHNELLRWK